MTNEGHQVGVVVAVPPFLYCDKDTYNIYRDSSILFQKNLMDYMHLGDVNYVDNDWHLAWESGYVLVVTGTGSTIEEARKQAYGRINGIILQNMFYRTDIGEKWYRDSDRLQILGYLYYSRKAYQ